MSLFNKPKLESTLKFFTLSQLIQKGFKFTEKHIEPTKKRAKAIDLVEVSFKSEGRDVVFALSPKQINQAKDYVMIALDFVDPKSNTIKTRTYTISSFSEEARKFVKYEATGSELVAAIKEACK